jgi:hypothetical protein
VVRRDEVFDADGRFTEAYLRRVVAEMMGRVGWSKEQAEEYVRVPEEVVSPVAADLIATLGWSKQQAETFVLQHALHWAAGVPRMLVVAEAVQQALHDDRIDTTWPACPRHPHHPLCLTPTLPASWACPATGEAFCGLGELSTLAMGE